MTLVYVVDDFENTASAEGRALRQLPVRLRVFSSAVAALAAARQDPPDVLVTDFFMPEMTGAALACQLQVLNPNLATVIITSEEGWELVGLDEVKGVLQMLRKPAPVAELTAAVLRAVRARAA